MGPGVTPGGPECQVSWGCLHFPPIPGSASFRPADPTALASAPTTHDATICSLVCKCPSIQYQQFQNRPGAGLNWAHNNSRTMRGIHRVSECRRGRGAVLPAPATLPPLGLANISSPFSVPSASSCVSPASEALRASVSPPLRLSYSCFSNREWRLTSLSLDPKSL